MRAPNTPNVHTITRCPLYTAIIYPSIVHVPSSWDVDDDGAVAAADAAIAPADDDNTQW